MSAPDKDGINILAMIEVMGHVSPVAFAMAKAGQEAVAQQYADVNGDMTNPAKMLALMASARAFGGCLFAMGTDDTVPDKVYSAMVTLAFGEAHKGVLRASGRDALKEVQP